MSSRFSLDEQYARREFVTPERAKELLGKLYERQRKRRNAYVTAYATDMTDDNWNPNVPSSIAISKSGKLIDGQHRLSAIVESGIGQWMWVFYDVDDDVYDYIDNGHNRTIHDRDVCVPDKTNTFAFVRRVVALDNGADFTSILSSASPVTQQQQINYVNDHRDHVIECVQCGGRIVDAVGGGTKSTYAFVLHMVSVIFGNDAIEKIESASKTPSVTLMTLQKKVSKMYSSMRKVYPNDITPVFMAFCDAVLGGIELRQIRTNKTLINKWMSVYRLKMAEEE